MKAKEIMTKDVATCREDQTFSDAARMMRERDCGSIPITDSSGALKGIVTDRDLLLAAQEANRPLSELPLSFLPAGTLRTVDEDTQIETVAATMAEHQVRRLPVLDSSRKVVGIVSLNDLAIHAEGNERRMMRSAHVLAAVSRHREPPTSSRSTPYGSHPKRPLL